MKSIYAVLLFLLVTFTNAQHIDVILAEQDGVSLFTDLLAQWPDLVDSLNKGVHTGACRLQGLCRLVADLHSVGTNRCCNQ